GAVGGGGPGALPFGQDVGPGPGAFAGFGRLAGDDERAGLGREAHGLGGGGGELGGRHHHAGPGVAEQLAELDRVVHGGHRDRDRPHAQQRQERDHGLGLVGGDEQHPLLGPHPERLQAGG